MAMIPIARAMLCIGEEILFDGSAGGRCPVCGSRNVIPIAKWLGNIHPRAKEQAHA